MLSRRTLFQFLPLSFLLGDAYRRRDAVGQLSPTQVATQLFERIRSGNLREMVESVAEDQWRSQRRAFDRLLDSQRRLGRQQQILNALKLSEAGWVNASDRELLLCWFAALDHHIRELQATLQEATLAVIGEVHESPRRVAVLYRLTADDLLGTIRPNVLQLVYDAGGWNAAFSEPPEAIFTAAIAALACPQIRIRVLGEVAEDLMQHFVCRAECRFPDGDQVAPTFCCTWPQENPAVLEMRSHDYGPLRQLLRGQILRATQANFDRLSEANQTSVSQDNR